MAQPIPPRSKVGTSAASRIYCPGELLKRLVLIEALPSSRDRERL